MQHSKPIRVFTAIIENLHLAAGCSGGELRTEQIGVCGATTSAIAYDHEVTWMEEDMKFKNFRDTSTQLD